jgi:predicted Holliday junction resolvase-like endonuclease
MQIELQYIIIWAIIGVIIWFLIAKILFIGSRRTHQKDAVRGSKNAIIGELYEKILPALPDFPYAPKDMVFIGKGCDYIIFDWLSDWHLREVVFLELKSGNARLNANESAIKYALDHKRVRFSEYRIDSTKNKS